MLSHQSTLRQCASHTQPTGRFQVWFKGDTCTSKSVISEHLDENPWVSSHKWVVGSIASGETTKIQASFLAFYIKDQQKQWRFNSSFAGIFLGGIRAHLLSMVMVNHENQPFILSWQGTTGSWDLLRYMKQLSRDSPPPNGHNKHTKRRCFHLPATPTDVHSRCNLKAKKLDRFWWLWIFHHRFSGQVMWDGWMDVQKKTPISIGLQVNC